MKGFKIIEAGRLDKQQMSLVIGGGDLYCESKGTITFENPGGTVSCPISYKSCDGRNNKLVCNLEGGYKGVPGGAGFGDMRDINL